MNLTKFQWNLTEEPDNSDEIINRLLAGDTGFSTEFLHLAVKRGITDLAQLEAVTDESPQLFHDPLLMHQMEKATHRIHAAIENQEPILIYGDYDADGITSTVVLYEALESLGAQVHYYIPHRLTDGYGPNRKIYQQLIEEWDIELIITVDNGVAGHEAINYAQSQNVDVIVTDHHELPEELPQAYAIIHPAHPQGNYPFKDLAGVGVAYKLASALLGELPTETLELVAIGTVADMVSLTDENRTLVLQGLRVMQQTLRIGLQLLLTANQVNLDTMDADTIGFVIGPHLNSLGRLGDANPVVELLRTYDESEAHRLVELLIDTNSERKALVEATYQEIVASIQQLDELPNVIIKGSTDWSVGVLGIVAGRLKDKFHRPVLLFEYQPRESLYKGSGRSIEGINLYQWLNEHASFLENFGGHELAAGVTVSQTNWQVFQEAMTKTSQQYVDQIDSQPQLPIDLELSVKDVDLAFIQEISRLGPFGIDNPKPLFKFKDVTLSSLRTIGRNQEHIKLDLSQAGAQLDSVGFSKANQCQYLTSNDTISIVGTLSINEWNNHQKPQLMIEDIGKEGSLWIDKRGSRVDPALFELTESLYVFNHEEIMAHYLPQLASTSQAVTYGSDVEVLKTKYTHLVLVEPPQNIASAKQLFVDKTWEKVYLAAYVQEPKYINGLPSRADFAFLYRWLEAQTETINIQEQLPTLSQRLEIPVSKLRMMLRVFYEAGFVIIEDGQIVFKVNPEFVSDLTSMPALKHYEEAMQAEEIMVYRTLQAVVDYFEE